MILKIDLEKTFDRIEWSYIRSTLDFFNFPHKMTQLIMSCVSFSSISILVNGKKTSFFNPSKRIRQEDPMSLYLFILCMERLSRNIGDAVKSKAFTPISITTGGPKISHLFFTDDVTLFS